RDVRDRREGGAVPVPQSAFGPACPRIRRVGRDDALGDRMAGRKSARRARRDGADATAGRSGRRDRQPRPRGRGASDAAADDHAHHRWFRLGHARGRGCRLMRRHSSRRAAAAGVSLVMLAVSASAVAQPGPGGFGGPPPQQQSAQESAQVDLTGYWVALVTEDWLWRMVTAPRGDATSVPLNPAGRRVAGEWDPERDAASGEECRPFGAAGLMRMPLRLHISWQDENTLKIETDAGEQTRLLHFRGDGPPAEKSWQGYTTAEWTRPVGGFDLRALFGGRPPAAGDGPPK